MAMIRCGSGSAGLPATMTFYAIGDISSGQANSTTLNESVFIPAEIVANYSKMTVTSLYGANPTVKYKDTEAATIDAFTARADPSTYMADGTAVTLGTAVDISGLSKGVYVFGSITYGSGSNTSGALKIVLS